MKCKIFAGDNKTNIENAINEWLKRMEEEITIVEMLQSQSKTNGGHSLTITIFYQEKQ